MQTHEKSENSAHFISEIICQNQVPMTAQQYLYSRPSIYLKLQACLSLNILALPME